MDIATITDVLDYVRKCSKLVNAFIIGIIRQTQADDLTKPIENVELRFFNRWTYRFTP